jgi:hypothetical protein
MSCSLHLITESGEIHLEMPLHESADEVLNTCTEGMRAGRVLELPDCLAPGAVERTTIVVNFVRVSVAWVEVRPS